MDKKEKTYIILSTILFFASIIFLIFVEKYLGYKLSIITLIIIVLYLFRILYGCYLYVIEKARKSRYSYSIMMYLGLMMFLAVNIIRQVILITVLIKDNHTVALDTIYNSVISSFSYFTILILPFILILSVYTIISNIVLIKKEGFYITNALGIIFGVFSIAIAFTVQYSFEFYKNYTLTYKELMIKQIVDTILNALLCYFYCIVAGTLYCNLTAARHVPKHDKDFVIVLGSQIRKDGSLTPLLKARVDKALEFYRNQKIYTDKNLVFVTSGGQGPDEIMAEGEAMRNYLLTQGVPETNIIIEDQSESTSQNLKFSKEKIDRVNKDSKIIFSTTDYHVFRSGVTACEQGFNCEGIGARSKWYFYANAIIREFIAGVVNKKYTHLFVITCICISIILTVLYGYSNGYIYY